MREFDVDTPNTAWVTDITYLATLEGWLYLAVILDLFSRRVVGYAMSERIDRELVLEALRKALVHRPETRDLIHHSDRGSQYASHDYRDALDQAGITCSMSRRGNCWDSEKIAGCHRQAA
jgi:transposase InsO family protein